MPVVGVLLYGFKIVALWSTSASVLVADFAVFDQSTLFGSAGAIVIIVGTIWMTFRTNAVKFWKDTAEAREQRIGVLVMELNQKSEEKHAAVAELAAERMKTDLTPALQSLVRIQEEMNGVLDSLVRMQEGMSERQRAQTDIAQALDRLSEGQLRIVSGQVEQNGVLTRIADRLESLNNQ